MQTCIKFEKKYLAKIHKNTELIGKIHFIEPIL